MSKIRERIYALCADAENEGRCVIKPSHNDRCIMLRMVKEGILVKPGRGLYARASYWKQLDPAQRHKHIVKAMQIKHPKWIFGGISAADIHNLDHDHELYDGAIYVVSTRCGAQFSRFPRVKYLHRNACQEKYATVDGVRVTTFQQTVADCIHDFDFVNGIQVANSALRRGTKTNQLYRTLRKAGHDCASCLQVLRHATKRCENGGESRAYAVMIQEKLEPPDLQTLFTNDSRTRKARTDYSWTDKDGNIVVAELDGREKYVDPEMTDGKSVEEIVDEERERERFLYACNVRKIVRFRVRETYDPEKFVRKLMQAGVPRSRST